MRPFSGIFYFYFFFTGTAGNSGEVLLLFLSFRSSPFSYNAATCQILDFSLCCIPAIAVCAHNAIITELLVLLLQASCLFAPKFRLLTLAAAGIHGDPPLLSGRDTPEDEFPLCKVPGSLCTSTPKGHKRDSGLCSGCREGSGQKQPRDRTKAPL